MASNTTPADLAKMAEQGLKQGTEALQKAAEGAASRVQAVAGHVTVENVKSALDTALGLWGKFDKDGDGELDITEAVALLNSPEIGAVVTTVTGVEHTQRTEKDVAKWFARADFDKDSKLTKREFTVMYMGLLTEKTHAALQTTASAVIQALDSDGDGIINSQDLKALLSNSPLAPVVKFIPDGKSVNYRELLAKLPNPFPKGDKPPAQ